MNKERAWKLLNEISFVRISGSDDEKRAAEIFLKVCQDAGVPAVIEEFEIEGAEISKVSLEVLEPEYREYPVIGIGKTASTPDEGIVGGFKYIENGMDANLTDIEGKIVMVQGRVMPDLVKKLKEKGALGYILLAGNIYEEDSIRHELRPSNAFGPSQEIPGIKIHMCDAEELIRSHPEKVRLVLKTEEVKGTSRNVVATIEGTDLKNEVVAFSGHYDSVPYSPGAWDNGTGAVTVIELMHYLNEHRPRRTMKFICCGSEEIGLVGSRKYCEQHKDELKDYIFEINFDMTGVTLGYEHVCCSCSEETMHVIEHLAKVEGFPLNAELGMYASDSSSFASAGVPSCTFARLAPRGGAEIHNHHDTMDRLDPDSFMTTLGFAAKFGEQIGNAAVNPVPRKFAEKVEKQIEERKKMFAMREGKPEEAKEEKKPARKPRKKKAEKSE